MTRPLDTVTVPDMTGAALELASLRFRVFPLLQRSKTPALTDWAEQATSDPDQIADWWGGRYRRCNIGIATGHGGLFVVDLAHLEAFEVFLAAHGLVPDTVAAVTGTGGVHFYFCAPTMAEVPPSGPAGEGVTVHGIGGFVVAPPSLHPNGTRYRWLAGFGITELPIADGTLSPSAAGREAR